MEALPVTISFTGVLRSLRAKVSVESGLPHRYKKDHVTLLTGVLLRGLDFDGL